MAQTADPGEEEVLGKAYDGRLARRLLRYAWPYRRLILSSLSLLLVDGGLQLVGPLLTRRVIDVAFPARDQGMIVGAVIVFGIALVAQFGCTYGETVLTARLGQRIMHDLRTQIFAHLQRLPMAFFDRNPVGRLVTRVTSDVESLNELFTSGVVAGLGDVFTLLAISVLMLLIDWKLAVASFAAIPLVVIASNAFRVRVREAYRAIRTRLARINAFLQERLSGIRVVQLFGREPDEAARFDGLNRDHLEAHLRSITVYALYFPAIEILTTVAMASLIVASAARVEGGTLTVGTVAAFLQLVRRFFEPLQDLSDKYNTLQQAMASSERIFKLIDEPVSPAGLAPALETPAVPASTGMAESSAAAGRRADEQSTEAEEAIEALMSGASGPTVAQKVTTAETRAFIARGDPPRQHDGDSAADVRHHSIAPRTTSPPRPLESASPTPSVEVEGNGGSSETPPVEIEFDRVWFAYDLAHVAHGADAPAQPEWVLRDVSFAARPGETLAIVGHTGAGKTTIINLLLRFYEPQRGRILVNGTDVADLPVHAVRRLIGYVQQDIFLFAGDIATNIRLASGRSDEEVVRAAVRVGADRIIRKLPGAYAYELGERGASVSVGERQLLSFARAIAADPAVLVLDEATSAVDSEIESEIQGALAELMRGRTTIAIAHRLSTIQRAEEILVMHHGEVRERGTHRELLASGGLYERLYRLQAGVVRDA